MSTIFDISNQSDLGLERYLNLFLWFFSHMLFKKTIKKRRNLTLSTSICIIVPFTTILTYTILTSIGPVIIPLTSVNLFRNRHHGYKNFYPIWLLSSDWVNIKCSHISLLLSIHKELKILNFGQNQRRKQGNFHHFEF